ncbi:hypothetical protein KOW79_006912 [Hemibagrus wyckioides]|uniref:Uncharacterized protein n=1 Tax=Hemibagrus wyckioides TaxID=337641 RepID=A0A9D3P0J8_9TELE|nr:hypothetical protein KOW79_006912 [Hemibagrus wyckioides]
MNFFGAFSGLPLRPLLLAAGAAAATASIYTYVKRSEDTTAEPEDTTEGPDTEVVKDQMMHPFERVIFVIQKLLVSKIQLQDRVKELEELLCEAHRDCDLKSKECERERETHNILQSKYDEMKKTQEILKDALAKAEEKHQKDVETISQLEEEKSDLTDQLKTLRETVEELGNQLTETHVQCDELTDEEKDEMKKTLSHMEELLKVTMAEAEEKHQKDVETIHQLEKEKSDLTEKVKTLRETVEDMGDQLFECNRECDELINECEREREAHNILQAENDEMMKTLSHMEELLKDALAEAEEKHQTDETIAELEKAFHLLKL